MMAFLNHTFALVLFFSIINFSKTYAQSAILDHYIEQGLAGNQMLKQQQYEIEKALLAISIAKSDIFPKIAFAPNYTVAAGGRKIDFPIGDLLNPVYNTLNKLTQSNNFPTVENERIQFLPNNFHETKLTFQLPLFNTDIKYNIQLQKDLAASTLSRKKTLEYELKYNIEVAYYQYLQSMEAVKIYEQAKDFLKEYRQFNQKLVDNKVALKDVLYASDLELSKMESQLVDAQKNTRVAKAYFNFLLNRDLEKDIEVDSTFYSQIPTVPDLKLSRENALIERPEFAELQAGMNTNTTLLQMQKKNAVLPTFFLGGNIGFQGYGYTFQNQSYALAQVGMNWDIFHGKEKKHKIEQTEIQNRILESKKEEAAQKISMQTTQAWYNLESARKNLENAEASTQFAQNLLDMTRNKYKNQNALYIEVLKVQNDHLVAGLNASLARFNIWLKKAELAKSAAF